MRLKKLWTAVRWIAIAFIACKMVSEAPKWILDLVAICILWPVPDWIKRRNDESDKGGSRNVA